MGGLEEQTSKAPLYRSPCCHSLRADEVALCICRTFVTAVLPAQTSAPRGHAKNSAAVVRITASPRRGASARGR